MRGLKVKKGVVINVAVFDQKIPSGWIESPPGVGKGFVDNGDGTFSPPEPKPVPQEEQQQMDNARLVRTEREALFDVLLDHALGLPLPDDFADRVTAYRAAKD